MLNNYHEPWSAGRGASVTGKNKLCQLHHFINWPLYLFILSFFTIVASELEQPRTGFDKCDCPLFLSPAWRWGRQAKVAASKSETEGKLESPFPVCSGGKQRHKDKK